jgi:hypothetical protein
MKKKMTHITEIEFRAERPEALAALAQLLTAGVPLRVRADLRGLAPERRGELLTALRAVGGIRPVEISGPTRVLERWLSGDVEDAEAEHPVDFREAPERAAQLLGEHIREHGGSLGEEERRAIREEIAWALELSGFRRGLLWSRTCDRCWEYEVLVIVD